MGGPGVRTFDTHALQYDAWFERHRVASESEVAALRALAPGRGRWLEVGVGTGRFAVPLWVGYGIEPSRNMGRIARERGIEVVRGRAEHLPFSDDSFDGVLFVTTICFVDDLPLSLREAHRVLQADGTLLVGFVDRESPLGREYAERRTRSVFYGSATFYSTRELLGRLEVGGFRESGVVQTIFHGLDELTTVEPHTRGYGRGSFVVVRARRIAPERFRDLPPIPGTQPVSAR